MLAQINKIHCIGIGGIGVSALAQLFHAQGKEVTGSDFSNGGHRPENVGDAELVVYSDAVPPDNVERVEARRRGILEMSYAQALGEVSTQYRTIVVTGTHGKSTTTAILGLMLEAAGFDPLVIVGSKVPEWEYGNLRFPNAKLKMQNVKWFVVEGDDYRDHFLELSPYAAVITNIEHDHPDYFRDLEHTVESFQKLVEKVPESGFAVVNEDDAGCMKLFSICHSREGGNPDLDPRFRGGDNAGKWIIYSRQSKIFEKLQLQIPGEFNRYNATAAAVCALELGVPLQVVQKALSGFKGIWRRFEVVGEMGEKGITVISDYGHHPTAIRATMKAAREFYPDRRLVLVYQPHQHSRTKNLFNDFVEALKDAADLVIVSEIYAVKGRMEDHNVSSRQLVEEVKKLNKLNGLKHGEVLYGGDLEETEKAVREHIQPGDVLIFMGAGDIDQIAREICLRN